MTRRFHIGAEVQASGVHFRVWAPAVEHVRVVLESGARMGAEFALASEAGGYHAALVPDIAAGTRYRLRLDDDPTLYADPASRFQPEGPHGSSQVIDPFAYAWSDAGWPGVARGSQVIYEMHVGTFTADGTWKAAEEHAGELARLGVTVIEVMPVGDFPGRFGWGYDGVCLFAPTRLYGTPDDFRAFVDRAHAHGVAVILDVVYNHCGAEGCMLKRFSPAYFSHRHTTEWGEAINFDGPDAGPVRDFFLANAGYWIEEFHLDGLRLDATQAIFDTSEPHIVREIVRRVRTTANNRRTYVIAENEPQDTRLVRPEADGGYGLDAVWTDDFHHAARVALTGRKEAYFTDYLGRPQEFVSAAKRGHLYQGQRYGWQRQRRGTPTIGVPQDAFVFYLQNHDQVANSVRGERLHRLTAPGRYRAMTALLLLGPATPLLFQGQEFCASSPFLYFADLQPGLAPLVRKGRAEFLRQFPSIAQPEVAAILPDPGDAATFERCKLVADERLLHAEAYALHLDLLALRRRDPVFREPRAHAVDGAVLGEEAFALRFFGSDADRLLLVNLGRDLVLDPAPEPLLAPPANAAWSLMWSSEHPRYGGTGHPPIESEDGTWRVPGHAASVFAARRDDAA